MMYRSGFKINRKGLYVFFAVLIVAVVSLTVAYAALSVTLNIVGEAEVSGANWDIHFDNVVLNSQSATSNYPSLVGNNITINTTLTKPGDFYEFTVDVVNAGSIDALIEKIEVVCDITAEQKKYINMDITYSNGSLITESQLLMKDTARTIKARVSYRTDITASDLPTETSNISFSYKLIYSQISSDSNFDSLGGIHGGESANTYIIALGKSWNAVPGVSLYDSINSKYEEMKSEGSSTYPRAGEFEIYDMDISHVFVDDNGKILNLLDTIVESGKAYKSTYFSRGVNATDSNLRSGNYVTVGIDISNLFSGTFGEAVLADNPVIPVFVGKNDTYVDVAHSIHPYVYLFLDANSVANKEQEVIMDYVLGLPVEEDAGCAVDSTHRFFGFTDENGNFYKITDKVNHGERRIAFFVSVDAETMTYEEARAMIIEQINSMLGQ